MKKMLVCRLCGEEVHEGEGIYGALDWDGIPTIEHQSCREAQED